MSKLLLLKYALLILSLIIIDQVSKWWIIEKYFKQGLNSFGFFEWLTNLSQDRLDFVRIEITSFFNLVMVWNEGVSFGLFSNSHDMMPLILSIFAILLSSVFAVWLSKSTSKMTSIPIAFVIAGALSNVWDRARFGAVADFFDMHVLGHHWPAFNIADSLIVVGVVCLAIDSLFFEPKRNPQKGFL
jgi:signal peptidase II